MKTVAAALIFLSGIPALAGAQTTSPSRFEVFGDIGYARTWDDEGLLGSGAGLTGGFGIRLTDRTSIQAVVSRIPYFRDIEYLTFDGRVIFAGAEASFRSRRETVRPFFTIGGGVYDDDRTWVTKTTIDPFLPRVHESSELHYTLAAFTTSGGVDVRMTGRASLRAGVRLYGLVQTGGGRDLAPHTIIEPMAGVAYRW